MEVLLFGLAGLALIWVVLLYRQAQHRAEELTLLNEIGRTVTSSLNLERVLATTMQAVIKTMRAEAGSILLFDQEGKGLVFEVAAGGGATKLPGCCLQPGQGVAGWVAEHGQSALIPEARRDPRFFDGIDAVTGSTTHSLLCVPLGAQERIIGVIEVLNKAGGEFSRHDLRLLESLAAEVAIAIENARLYETIRAERSRVEQLLGQVLTAQEDERRRLSLDLHDTVTQSMYGVLARIHAAERLLSMSVPDQAGVELTYAKEALEQTLSDLRRVAADLHPPVLDRAGLVDALSQYIEQFAEGSPHLSCSLELKGRKRQLPSRLEIGIYRIVQVGMPKSLPPGGQPFY